MDYSMREFLITNFILIILSFVITYSSQVKYYKKGRYFLLVISEESVNYSNRLKPLIQKIMKDTDLIIFKSSSPFSRNPSSVSVVHQEDTLSNDHQAVVLIMGLISLLISVMATNLALVCPVKQNGSKTRRLSHISLCSRKDVDVLPLRLIDIFDEDDCLLASPHDDEIELDLFKDRRASIQRLWKASDVGSNDKQSAPEVPDQRSTKASNMDMDSTSNIAIPKVLGQEKAGSASKRMAISGRNGASKPVSKSVETDSSSVKPHKKSGCSIKVAAKPNKRTSTSTPSVQVERLSTAKSYVGNKNLLKSSYKKPGSSRYTNSSAKSPAKISSRNTINKSKTPRLSSEYLKSIPNPKPSSNISSCNSFDGWSSESYASTSTLSSWSNDSSSSGRSGFSQASETGKSSYDDEMSENQSVDVSTELSPPLTPPSRLRKPLPRIGFFDLDYASPVSATLSHSPSSSLQTPSPTIGFFKQDKYRLHPTGLETITPKEKAITSWSKLPLVDVSSEDDSLLASPSQSSLSKISERHIRRKNGKFRLQKISALDSAFFTSEGLLESDELSFINNGLDKTSPCPLLRKIRESSPCSSRSHSECLTLLERLEVDLFEDMRASSIQRLSSFESSSKKAVECSC